MIKKAKEVLNKLEFGILEICVGALMIIGLIGYFGTVSADLDWIDHTISFILFTYLFYKLNITSILFGKTSKISNLLIVLSYFSLFFKDIIGYTALSAFKFAFLNFIDYFYLFFNNNLFLTTISTFYIGLIGLLIISFYLTFNIKISHPSLLYAIHKKEIKNKFLKFISIFIVLFAFYHFVYSAILEWLEFTLDDPIIAIGIIYYIHNVAKHHAKFNRTNFIFKIGDISTNFYERFISMFHYKKTLTLAVSGLLILHALTDLGVFAYSMTFMKENFYLENLKTEHVPFFNLFIKDSFKLDFSYLIPLMLAYILNLLSLIIFLVIPIIVWAQMFLKRELHMKRIFLFIIYSSIISYLLLPGFKIGQLSDKSIVGVDISTISLLESNSFLSNLIIDKQMLIIVVLLISLTIGLTAYLLSINKKIRRELYAVSILAGLVFYTFYIYYFFISLANYLYGNIIILLPSKHFLIGLTLVLLLFLSILFYVGGYLLFIYEIVMEYHKRKWSESIDNNLYKTINRMKKRV